MTRTEIMASNSEPVNLCPGRSQLLTANSLIDHSSQSIHLFASWVMSTFAR